MNTKTIDISPNAGTVQQKHQVFINEMIAHGDKLRAYQAAYPNAQGAAARAAAARLIARPHIAQQIQQAQQEAKRKAIDQLQEHTAEVLEQELTTIAQKRAILARMMSGQWQTKRYINLRDRVEEVTEDISDYALLRAIELDTKLAQLQEQLTQAEEITLDDDGMKPEGMGAEEFAKNTLPFPKYGDAEAMRFWCSYHYGPDYYDNLMKRTKNGGGGTP